MAKIISFEGPIGVGKTTLVNYLATNFNFEKSLEQSQNNPFIDKFYAGENVKLETELTFLLLHYSLLKNLILKPGVILTDFSIEKDLVFARMNLNKAEFELFKHTYDYAIESVGKPDLVFYLDLPFDILWQRISKRGRPYEINTRQYYFKAYGEQLKQYFLYSSNEVIFYDTQGLELNKPNLILNEIKTKINSLFYK